MAWDTGDIPQFRKRRNIRGPVTLVLLIGLLGGAAWYGWKSVLGGDETAAVTQVCSTPSPAGKQRIAAKDVTLNIYNAGKVKGLADRTSEQLLARGFKVDDIGNDAQESKVKNVELRGRAKNAPEVLLMMAQVTGAIVVPDGRQEATVDFVLGSEFAGLRAKAPKELEVTSPLAVCTTSPPTPQPTASAK